MVASRVDSGNSFEREKQYRLTKVLLLWNILKEIYIRAFVQRVSGPVIGNSIVSHCGRKASSTPLFP